MCSSWMGCCCAGSGICRALMYWAGLGLCYVLCFCAMSPSSCYPSPFTGWVASLLPERGLRNVQRPENTRENRQKQDKELKTSRCTDESRSFLITSFAASFIATRLCYFLTVCQDIHGGSSSKGKAGHGEESRPCGECVHGRIYDSVLL